MSTFVALSLNDLAYERERERVNQLQKVLRSTPGVNLKSVDDNRLEVTNTLAY